ncbi:RNA-binding protein 45-like [Vanessa atalanta]|uniref:RNA-binding protein 45-like n=1 Tax=Vanessa atalanta TaxID=42275 RepID=UPI001FCDEB32|nr:RNA-binding protein 45-like [Vanessa atalanta]
MENRNKYSRNDEKDREDSPIYSRLFIVCDRNLKEEQFRTAFSEFGCIEDIRIPRHHKTGEPKGIVFIKFSKTSEAAKALESMNIKFISNSTRALKVMVAANRSEIQSEDYNYDKYRRLFIHIPKDMTEDALEDNFKKFGFVEDVLIQRDRDTGTSKGFAYITYQKFSEAAIAFEECDRKYRAIFAQPKGYKRNETSYETNIKGLANSTTAGNQRHSLMSMMNVNPRDFTRVNFTCSPYLTQMQVDTLFDIIPGMANCTYFIDLLKNIGTGSVLYSNPISAAYAVKKLNGFEYPPGQSIFVEPSNPNLAPYECDFPNIPSAVNNLRNLISLTAKSSSPDLAQLAEAIAEASKLIKVATSGASGVSNPDTKDLNYCSVRLPAPQPLAHIDSPVAKRCFLVCKPQPPPLTVLRDIFCRFGNLINVYTLPNKTVGYARYAVRESADEAIRILHGAEVCGVRIKVIEAEAEAPAKKIRLN